MILFSICEGVTGFELKVFEDLLRAGTAFLSGSSRFYS